MADSTLEQELNAIKTITEALQPLDDPTRRRALSYAMEHLGLSSSLTPSREPIRPERRETAEPAGPAQPARPFPTGRVVDIRSLKEQKQPASDIEMATLVAYYLRYEAPEDEHKDEIGTEDVEKYFVQAGYPLPTEKRYTLPNAKKAGYLENASRGKYKLNSVGHNLVAHGLPRSAAATAPAPRRRKPATNKAPKKKGAKRAKKTSRK